MLCHVSLDSFNKRWRQKLGFLWLYKINQVHWISSPSSKTSSVKPQDIWHASAHFLGRLSKLISVPTSELESWDFPFWPSWQFPLPFPLVGYCVLDTMFLFFSWFILCRSIRPTGAFGKGCNFTMPSILRWSEGHLTGPPTVFLSFLLFLMLMLIATHSPF